jgi:hypothetical protein
MQIGGIDLSLGMRQEDVLRQLGVAYDLQHIDSDPGNWMVNRKGGPPILPMGALGFRNNRLYFMSRTWGPIGQNNQTASGLSAALFNAIKAVAGQGRQCELSTRGVSPALQQIVFQCGRHELSIDVTQDPQMWILVHESVR